MQITHGKRGDYAIRAALELARRHGGGRLKARELAEAMAIPRNYLPQILARLVRGRLLTAVAGRDGGYELARPPRAISLLEVVNAAEGAVSLQQCVLRDGPCERGGVCAVHEFWAGAQDALARWLASVSLADLVERDGEPGSTV